MDILEILETGKAEKEMWEFVSTPKFQFSVFGLGLRHFNAEDKIIVQMKWFFIYVNRYKSFCSDMPLPKNISAEVGDLVVEAMSGMIYYLLDVEYMDITFPIRIAVKFFGAALDLRGGRRDVTIVMHKLVPSDKEHPMRVFHDNIVDYYHPCFTEEKTYEHVCETFRHVKEMEKRNKSNRRRNRGRKRS